MAMLMVVLLVSQPHHFSGVASEYKEPYSLPENYTIEDLKAIVVEQRERPELEGTWKINKVHIGVKSPSLPETL